ncbi:hypothetical protein [Streptomyces chartreusis]|uniref:Uncharacterized protein n=1 Tax=Streptomyces chartreusis TaxID=1969 RepID=A0A7H8TBG7_STRCX|nr:hypothetical protein [Streptomyces chartreusis]QKZ20338.1 hypothetical protein HUT05_25100 [Streptomyces chartreusis]
MTTEIPGPQPVEDPLATGRHLLEAEAARRGISVPDLVNRLAREGHYPGPDAKSVTAARRGGAVTACLPVATDVTGSNGPEGVA